MPKYQTLLETAEQAWVPRAKAAREAHLKHLEWLRICAAQEKRIAEQAAEIQRLLSERRQSHLTLQRAVRAEALNYQKIGEIRHYMPDSVYAIVPINLASHEELPGAGTEVYLKLPKEV